MNLKPMYDKIVVKQDTAKEKTSGGIFMPESSKEKPRRGEVVATGPGLLLQDGSLAAMPVNVGDRVYFTPYGGTEIEVDGQKYLIMGSSDILAVIQ